MQYIMRGFWVLVVLSAMTVLVIIIGQNQEPMSVTLFSTEVEPQPKWRILLICMFLGALFSAIFFTVSLVVLETKNIRLSRTNRKLMKALEKAGLGDPAHKNLDEALDLGPSIQGTASAAQLLDDESDV
jgi:hypothetical protein